MRQYDPYKKKFTFSGLMRNSGMWAKSFSNSCFVRGRAVDKSRACMASARGASRSSNRKRDMIAQIYSCLEESTSCSWPDAGRSFASAAFPSCFKEDEMLGIIYCLMYVRDTKIKSVQHIDFSWDCVVQTESAGRSENMSGYCNLPNTIGIPSDITGAI